jgi:hypothetical protein
MKLAEALLLRADMQKKLYSLGSRIEDNAMVQEGESTHEDAEELIKEAFQVIAKAEALIARVYQANLTNRLPNGVTLTEALAQRDTLAGC